MVIKTLTSIMPSLQKAMDNTAEELLNALMKIIEDVVYSYHSPTNDWTNGWDGDYGRTGQFKESWEKSKSIIAGNIIKTEIMQNITQNFLEYQEPFSHGSEYKGGEISAENLDDIINNGLRDTGIGFPEMQPRPFWADFEKYVDTNLDDIFVRNCMGVGLLVNKGLVGYSF